MTPTPAFPVTIGCTERTPDDACTRLWERVAKQPENFTWITDTTDAQVVFDIAQGGGIGRWTYAVAAPFFTVDDDVTTDDLLATWSGTPAGPFVQHPLVVADVVGGDHGRAGALGDGADRGQGVHAVAEEAGFDPHWRRGVLVDDEAHALAFAQRFQDMGEGAGLVIRPQPRLQPGRLDLLHQPIRREAAGDDGERHPGQAPGA